MVLGVPLSELLLLAALVVVAGFVTGILAGLFGIGGGASIAIIVPTNVFSYFTHRGKGAVMMDVVRAWAVPAVIGVAVGSAIAAFASGAVLKLAFVLIASVIAFKL